MVYAREGFEKSGFFEVMAALDSGRRLLQYLTGLSQSELPNLVLSDLNMPGLNGYDVLERLKRNPEFSRLPVYISSTSTSVITIDKCKNLGAKDYLVKPPTLNKYDEFASVLYKKIQAENTYMN